MLGCSLKKRYSHFLKNVRHIKCGLFLSLCFTIAAGCSSHPKVNVDNGQNFSDIKTFYIKAPLNSTNAVLAQHVSSTITKNLISKGLTPSTDNNADVSVGYLPSTSTKEDGATLNLGLGTGSFGRSRGISIGSIFSIPVGEQTTLQQSLQIDIVKDGNFIYSASGSIDLKAKDSISVQNALDELIGTLLEQYPQRNSLNK